MCINEFEPLFFSVPKKSDESAFKNNRSCKRLRKICPCESLVKYIVQKKSSLASRVLV